MTISILTAQQTYDKLKNGAILVDIREQDEFEREHIHGAVCMPFTELQTSGLNAEQKGKTVIFCCKSGGRTQSCNKQLDHLSQDCESYILEGGINAWKKAGFTIIENKKAPLPIMRQVQIAAGSLVLLGMLLGSTLHPFFYLLTTFVGAGLIFAGISGFCGMAVLLNKMPWNK